VVHRPTYEALTSLLRVTIENLVRADGIEYLAVTSRTKSVESFVEKTTRKGYLAPDQATDLAGIRVITFVEPDAVRASNLFSRAFTAHQSKSLDKSEELGDSQVGYRSVHLVCELSADRIALPEYKPYQGLFFEIQVRTVLQHAWAEIEHDRGYKFKGVLPQALRRRLNLLAGQLEMADQEFARLARDVDTHAADLRRKQAQGSLDIELTSDSIAPFLREQKIRNLRINASPADRFAGVIDELQVFGVKTLADLQGLLSDDFRAAVSEIGGSTTQIGLLRKAMMYADLDKYFREAWRETWQGASPSTNVLVVRKWGIQKAKQYPALETSQSS
jgi:putative GTP pyrophosphokinase